MSTRKPEGGLVSANAAARVTMHPQGFAYVYDCHTCACDMHIHVHVHVFMLMSDPAFGDHARLEPRLNGADNMHARARAFWCASRRTIQTGRTVCVCMLSSASVQFLSYLSP